MSRSRDSCTGRIVEGSPYLPMLVLSAGSWQAYSDQYFTLRAKPAIRRLLRTLDACAPSYIRGRFIVTDSSGRWSLPFVTGVGVQRYLPAEDGLVDAYEQGCSHWYIDLSLLSEMPGVWDQRRRAALANSAASLGLSPIIHGNFRTPLATEIPQLQEAALAYVREEIKLAAQLNAAALVIHGGAFVEPRPTKANRALAFERFLALLTSIVREASDQGVEIWLENLSYYPKYRPFTYIFTRDSDFAKVLDALPRLKFILDVGHANVNQAAALTMFSAYFASVAALSLSNNAGDQDSHLALDQGTLSITDLLGRIRSTDWKGVIAFETRNASIPSGIGYLRKLWKEIGGWPEHGGPADPQGSPYSAASQA
jgi:sugar phosphate isomerase/epimerase